MVNGVHLVPREGMTTVVTKAGQPGSGEPDGTGRYRPGYELVAEQILRYIASEDLRPGSRLPTEQGLADILGATRNVTREAVKVLAAIGRLSVRRGAGIFVASGGVGPGDDELAHFQPTDLEQVLMLLDYRCLLEAETARRAASIATPIEVRAIRESAEESARVGERGDAEAFPEADQRFHGAVSAAAANVFLRSAVASTRRFAAQSDVLLFHGAAPGSLGDAGRQHVEIARAIADGDPDRASELMRAHIGTTRQQFQHRIHDRLFRPTDRG
jgi:DNA-binding FadR family transcriptional regulator